MRTKNLSAHRSFKSIALFICVAIAGCVTVNVNFPESAVQRAADSFVKDLYQPAPAAPQVDAAVGSAQVKNSVKKVSKKKSTNAPANPVPSAPVKAGTEPSTWLISFGLAEAYAQEINTSSPKAATIKARMKDRVAEISLWKAKGAVCETADGMLVFKHPEKAGAAAGAVTKLVKAENDDRDALYAEIQDTNKITDRKQTRIRSIFSAAFKENSPAGTCFE